MRWCVVVSTRLNRASADRMCEQDVHIRHPAQVLLHEKDIDMQIETASCILCDRMENFTDVQGSGWNIERVLKIDFFIAAYDSILVYFGVQFYPHPQINCK